MRNKELAERAAKFWAGYLREPEAMSFNNGDMGRNGPIAQMLFDMGKKKHPDEKIDLFEKLLTEYLLDETKRQFYMLSVDYHPDDILSECLGASLVKWNSTAIFPCKTAMYIDWENDKLFIKEGSGAERREIEKD